MEKVKSFFIYFLSVLIETFYRCKDSGDTRIQKDSLKVIRKQSDAAIKSNFPDFVFMNEADVKSRASGHDLLLYIQDAKTAMESPSFGLERSDENQQQHDNTIKKIPIQEKQNKIQTKCNHIAIDRAQPQNINGKSTWEKSADSTTVNVIVPILPESFHHSSEGFEFEISPKQFGQKSTDSNSVPNAYQISDVAAFHRKNHQHHLTPSHNHHLPSRNENRFYVNQNGNEAAAGNLDQTLIETMPAGVINDPYSHELRDFDRINQQRVVQKSDENHAIKYSPQSFDVRVELRKDKKDDEALLPYQIDNLEPGKKIFRTETVSTKKTVFCEI